MRKKSFRVKTILSLLVCFVLLTGCKSPQLPASFKEEEVKKAAEEVIRMLNEKDSQALLEISTVQLKSALKEDVLEEIFEALAEGGEFEKIEKMSLAGQKDKTSEEEYAVVIAKAKYEIKYFVYTISFTQQMKLAGLYYK